MSVASSKDHPAPIPLHVLLVEDRETDTELIVRELKKHGFEPSWVRVDTEADFLEQIHKPFDLVTADAIMPQFSASRVVTLLQEHQLDIPCIVISGSIGEEEAVALIRAGASDYLMKDRLGRLGQAIRYTLDQRRLRDEHRQAHKALITLNEELERRIAERTAKLEEVNQTPGSGVDRTETNRAPAQAARSHPGTSGSDQNGTTRAVTQSSSTSRLRAHVDGATRTKAARDRTPRLSRPVAGRLENED